MRYYSSVAAESALNAPISPSATSMVLTTVSGFPINYPYTLSIDSDNSSAELVEVTAAAGTTLTVVRGVDGTTATSHSLGATVRHDHSGRDFRESREHEAATVGVHGVAGSVVGTTDTQTLTNKNLATGNTFPSNFVLLAAAQALTNKDLTSGTNTFPSSLATLTDAQTLTNKNLTSGTNTFPTSLVTLTGSQTLTFKNLTSGTNTFPTSLVTLTGTQTLTNKTLTAPVMTAAVSANGVFTAPEVWEALYVRDNKNANVIYEVANLAALPAASDGALGGTTDDKLYQRRNGAWVEITDVRPHIRLTAGSTTSLSDGVSTKITGFSNVVDAGVDITYANGDFTIAKAGLYIITGVIGFAANNTGIRRAMIYVGTDEQQRATILNNGGSSATDVLVTTQLRLAAADVVSLRGLQNTGASLNNTTTSTSVSITKVGE